MDSSPLAKRIAFLESKGLTSSEIEESLRRASNLTHSSDPFGAGYRRVYPPDRDATDWRDWFVMTVVGGGVGYLLINLAKKYLLPALRPPTQTELEEAQTRLEQKYDEISGILQTIQTDTEIVKNEMTQQTEKLGQAIKEVESAIDECLSGEIKRDEELMKIQSEVDGLRTSMKQMMQSNKEAQTAAITDLQSELKSLKSLMAARPFPSSYSSPSQPITNGVSSSSSHPGSGLNTFGIQPPSGSSLSKFHTAAKPIGIPAWQLASGYNTTPIAQTLNGEPSSKPINSPANISASTSSSATNHLNGDDHPGSPSPSETSPEPSNHRHGCNEEDDDHIVHSKYASDDAKPITNGILNKSKETMVS